MLTKSNSRRSGFTLVEIMIVVAIIALLASIAVPSFLRARKRSQATAVLETLRMVDGAKDQYAIENGKGGTVVPVGGDLAPYVKNGSKLYSDLVGSGAKPLDALGNIIDIKAIDTPPQVADATKGALSDALGKDAAATNAFFGSYQ
jgi:prepilin-type N-terminal cleavage/methylation domain-containing protein